MSTIAARSESVARRIKPAVCAVAERVIAGANRRRPADAMLREELRAQRGFTREDGALASKAVFAWFRWRGWLDERQAIQQIREAIKGAGL